MISPIPETRRGLRGPCWGIDPSLHRTGWGLVDASGTLMSSGSVQSDPKLPVHMRIYSIARQLAGIWYQFPVKPAHMAIEFQTVGNIPGKFPGAQPKQNIEVALTLSRLQGAIVTLILAHTSNSSAALDVIEPTPAEWRKQIGAKVVKDPATGKNERGKDAGLREIGLALIRMRVDFNRMKEDQVEGIGIAIACQIEHARDYPMARRRAELKVEKKARKARAKIPKVACGICHTRIVRGGILLDTGLLTGPVLVHAKCRLRPAGGK